MKQKDILFIFISSFVVVAAWVGFNLYHKWATTTISTDLQIQINPIESSFDRDTIEKLKQRKNVAPSYEIDGAQPTPTIGFTPTKPTPAIEQVTPVEQTSSIEQTTTAENPPPTEASEIPPEGDTI